MKVRDLIAEFLRDRSHIFGVGGANIEGLFLSFHQKAASKIILAKHEAAAVHMAEGYFRARGHAGIILTTSGAGAFNTLASLTEALASDIPMLLIAGQIPSQLEGKGGFQDSSGQHTALDAEAIFARVCRRVTKLQKAEEILPVLGDLLRTAEIERGPTVLLINRDLLEAEVTEPQQDRTPDPSLETYPPPSFIVDLLKASSKTVVIAGKSVLYEGASELLTATVRSLGAQVVLTPDAKGLWDHNSVEFAGLLGAMGHIEAMQAIADADLVLCIGSSLPVMSRIPTIQALKGKILISINRRSSFVSSDDEVTVYNLLGPIRQRLQELLRELPTCKDSHHKRRNLTFLDLSQSVPEGDFIGLKLAFSTIQKFLTKGIDVFIDAGNVGAAAVHYLQATGHNIFSIALGMGGMGHSFGCAVGACLASGRQSFVMAGDGSFYMHGMEIHTAWQHRLPIIFFIFNNNAHGMCHVREEIYFGYKSGDNLFRSSYPATGMGHMLPGLGSFEVKNTIELQEAIKQALNFEGPSCISLNISPDEIPPFLPFLNSHTSKDKSYASRS